jgi:platelet-activating factor acetylhydrolase IB subunit alpha
VRNTDQRGSNKAILAYLGVIGANDTLETFRKEGKIAASFDDATRKKYEGLLEKKWTSVVRLQKKVATPRRG